MSGAPSPPSNLRVVADSTTSLTFSWDPPADTGSGPLTGYKLSIAADPSDYILYYTTTLFTVIHLEPTTKYTASIQATNDNCDTFSEAVYFQPMYPGETVPNPPSSCSAQRATNTSAYISWDQPAPFIGPDVKWIVIQSVSNNPNDPARSATANAATQSSYSITNLNPLSTYTFTLYAVNSLGYSDPSSTNSVLIFQPNNLPGCMVWLDASDSSTVLQTDQGTVSTWLDKSGCGRNTTGHGQTYTGSSIQFTNNKMNVECPALTQQTILMVATPSSTENTKYVYDELSGSSVPSIVSNYTDGWAEYFNGIDRATFTQTPTARFMAAFEYDQGVSVKGYYNSETPVFSIVQRQINTVPVSYSHIGSDQSIDAQICELIFINGILESSDWSLLVSYLRQKWGF